MSEKDPAEHILEDAIRGRSPASILATRVSADIDEDVGTTLQEITRNILRVLLPQQVSAGRFGIDSPDTPEVNQNTPRAGDTLVTKYQHYTISAVESGKIIVQGLGATTGYRAIPIKDLKQIQKNARLWKMEIPKALHDYPRCTAPIIRPKHKFSNP